MKIIEICALIGLLTFLAACSGTSELSGAVDVSDLEKSGFRKFTTQEVPKSFLEVPAGQITPVDVSGLPVFVYRDPESDRVFTGGPGEVQAYQELRTRRNARMSRQAVTRMIRHDRRLSIY